MSSREPFWGNQLNRRCQAVYKKNNSIFVISSNGPSLSLFRYVSKTNKTEATLRPVTEIMLFHPVSSEIMGVSCDSSGDVIVAHTARHVAVLSDSILRAGGLLCFSNIYSIESSFLLGVSFLQNKSFAFLYVNGIVEEWKVLNTSATYDTERLKPERTRQLCKFKLRKPNEMVVAFHFDTTTTKKRLAVGTSAGSVFYTDKWKVTRIRYFDDSRTDSAVDRRYRVETVLLVDNYVMFTLFGGATTVYDVTGNSIQGDFCMKRSPNTSASFASSSIEETTAITGSKDGNITFWKWKRMKPFDHMSACFKQMGQMTFSFVQLYMAGRTNAGFGPILSIHRDSRMPEVIIGCENGGLFLMEPNSPQVMCERYTAPPNTGGGRFSNSSITKTLSHMLSLPYVREFDLGPSFRKAIEILKCQPIREVVYDDISLKQFKDYSILFTGSTMLIAKVSFGINSGITAIRQLMVSQHPRDRLNIQQVFLVGFASGHIRAIIVPSRRIDQLAAAPFEMKPHVVGPSVNIGRAVVDIHIAKDTGADERYRILVAAQERIFRIAIQNTTGLTRMPACFSAPFGLRIIQSEPICYTQHIQTPIRFVSHARGLMILAHVQDQLIVIEESTRTIKQRIDCGIHQEMVIDAFANDKGGITVGHGKNGDEYRMGVIPWPYFPVIRPAHGCHITGIRLISTDGHLALIATSGADGSVVTSIFNEDTGLWKHCSRLTEKSSVRFFSGIDVEPNVALSPLRNADVDALSVSSVYFVSADGCLTTSGIISDRGEYGSLEDIHRVCCVSRDDAVVSCLSVSVDNVFLRCKAEPEPGLSDFPAGVPSAVIAVGYSDGRKRIFRAPIIPCNVPPLLIGSIDNKDCPMTKCAVSLLCTAEVEPCKLEVLAIYTNGFVRKFHVNYFMRDSMQHPDGIISSKGENTASSMFQSSVTAHSDCSPTSDCGAPRQKEGVSCNCKPIKRDLITCGAELRLEYKEDCFCSQCSDAETEDTHLIVLGCESGRLTGTVWQPFSYINDFPQYASTLTTLTSHVLQVDVHASSKNSEFRCVALCMDGSITLLKLLLAQEFVEDLDETNYVIRSEVLSKVYTSVHRPSSFSRIHSKHERYAVAGDGIEIVRLWEFQEL